jgi:2-C-methyl-D-erythritol 4-phosphate cytidylyltransferase
VVPAAGRGERLRAGVPKALQPLAGRPLLVHAVLALQAAPSVGMVVVAAPPAQEQQVCTLLGPGVCVVPGGVSRQESVANALAVLAPEVDAVLVHDAARPLTPPSLIESVARAVLDGAPAVVPGLPIPDTVKRVDPAGRVLNTLDRSGLRAVQTPQGFSRALLETAHARGRGDLTDDAGLVEQLGQPVLVIPGEDAAFKVTHPADLARAEAFLDRCSLGADGCWHPREVRDRG